MFSIKYLAYGSTQKTRLEYSKRIQETGPRKIYINPNISTQSSINNVRKIMDDQEIQANMCIMEVPQTKFKLPCFTTEEH